MRLKKQFRKYSNRTHVGMNEPSVGSAPDSSFDAHEKMLFGISKDGRSRWISLSMILENKISIKINTAITTTM